MEMTKEDQFYVTKYRHDMACRYCRAPLAYMNHPGGFRKWIPHEDDCKSIVGPGICFE